MSLTYRADMPGLGFWALAISASLALHFVAPVHFLLKVPAPLAEIRDESGLTGAIMFDLSDIIAAPAEAGEDSAEIAESQEAPTVTESAEAVDPARAADEPLLSQIPYEVEDESLKFGVSSPDTLDETEELAQETATEFDPQQLEAPSQMGAEQADASTASVSGVDAEQQAERAKAKQKGLTSEQKEEVRAWQRSIVLSISKAKQYPPLARKKRIEGEVHLKFVIDKYGNVLSSQIEKSSGSGLLDDAAMMVLSKTGKLPTAPNYLDGDEFTLIIPLRYRFK